MKKKGNVLIMQGELSYKQSKYQQLLERFADSGYAICEIEINDEELSKCKSSQIATRIKTSAIRYGKPHIRAIAYKERVYLVNSLRS